MSSRAPYNSPTGLPKLLLTAVAACVLATVLAGLVWSNAARERTRILTEDRARFAVQLQSRERLLTAQIELLRGDARFLAAVPPVGGMVRAALGNGFDAAERTPGALWRRRLEKIFAAYAAANPRISKLRFIGVANGGRELVFVARAGAHIVIPPPQSLRSIGTQEYFRAALHLRAGETYVSDIGLSRPVGGGTGPGILTMRAATPVFDPAGRIFGALVVNLDARPLLAAIEANPVQPFDVFLTNSSGHDLIAPDAARTVRLAARGAQRWRNDSTSVHDGDEHSGFEDVAGADGVIHTLQRSVSLDARRFLTLRLAFPDRLVERQVESDATLATFALALGCIVTGGLVLLYVALARQATAQRHRYAAMIESSSDAIIGITLAGVVTDWNSAAERMFGYRTPDAVGRTVLELIVPAEAAAEDDAILSRAGSGEIVPHFRTRRRHQDGRSVDVSVTVSPIYRRGRVVGASKVLRDVSEHVRAERDSSEAQARLKLTTQSLGIALWDWNPTTGAVTWDETLATLYGRALDDFAPDLANWRAAVHPEDVDAVDGALATAVTGGAPYDTSFRIVTPSGDVRHIRAKGTLTFDAAGAPVRMLGINFDVTREEARERHVVELNATLEAQVLARTAELREMSALQRAILTDAALAIIATDVDGTITLFNPAAERFLGYRADEMVGLQTLAIIHDVNEVVARAQALTLELGKPVEPGFEVFIVKARAGGTDANEWTYIRKDGSRFPVLLSVTALMDDNGAVFGYLGMIVDQTERRMRDEALAASRRFLQAVTDNIPSLVGYWDVDLRCGFANEPFRRAFGKTEREMRGIRMSDLLTAPTFERSRPHIAGALRGEPQSFESELVRPDGTIAHTWVHYIPDTTGGIVNGFYVLVSDVSELKATELRLAALNEALQARTTEAEAATLSKSQFLANMSHEIRSPMNAILGMLELLKTTELTPRQADYAVKASSATQSLLTLLNDILDFSKVEAGKIELERAPFEIESMLRDVATLVSASLGDKPIEFLFDVDETLPRTLVGDAFRLRQVLLNLAGNAVKFTAAGDITIGLRERRREANHCTIEFAVSDTGIGIASHQLTRIFEGFNQGEAATTRRFGGTGLGLAISARLVALMGGRIDASSEPGVGSRFAFTLTFECDDAADAAAAAHARFHDRRHVLIVEDHERSGAILASVVRRLGWEAAVVSSGPAALDAIVAARAARPFDLMLIDSTPTAAEAWLTARQARTSGLAPDAAVIAMTGTKDLQEMSAQMESVPGIVDAVLIKPILPTSLIAGIDEVAANRATGKTSGPQTTPSNYRESSGRLSGLKVLVVDDNTLNQEVAAGLLTFEQADVVIADSGASAIATVLRTQPPFDAVLLDIQMPGMDGYETTRRLRELPAMRGVPVIAMTANAMQADRLACLQAGMVDHISKPIDSATVVRTLLCHARPRPFPPEVTPAAAPPPAPAEAAHDAPPEPVAASVIELDSALARLGYNESLFVTVAEMFIDDSARLAAELSAELRAGELVKAAATAHKFKGTAATVGNVRLADAAAELERGLKANEAPIDVEGTLEAFVALVTRGNRELRTIIRNLGGAIADADEEAMSGENIDAMLAEVESTRRDLVDLRAALDQTADRITGGRE